MHLQRKCSADGYHHFLLGVIDGNEKRCLADLTQNKHTYVERYNNAISQCTCSSKLKRPDSFQPNSQLKLKIKHISAVLLRTYIDVVSAVDDVEGQRVKVEQLGQRRDVTRAAVVLYQVDVSVRRATTAAAAAPATRTWLLHYRPTLQWASFSVH